jgi:hypothetical protein
MHANKYSAYDLGFFVVDLEGEFEEVLLPSDLLEAVESLFALVSDLLLPELLLELSELLVDLSDEEDDLSDDADFLYDSLR